MRLGGVGVRVLKETGLPTELVLLPDDDGLELLVVVVEPGTCWISFVCRHYLERYCLPSSSFIGLILRSISSEIFFVLFDFSLFRIDFTLFSLLDNFDGDFFGLRERLWGIDLFW